MTGVRPGARAILPAALVGSVLPDSDLLYFYLVDGGRVHHHAYVTHWPLFWVGSAMIALPLIRQLAPRFIPAAIAFFVALMIHMVLDTIAAPIQWLMPFDATNLEFVRIPARFHWWMLSFVFHWTFAVELAICGWAAWLALKQARPAELSENRA